MKIELGYLLYHAQGQNGGNDGIIYEQPKTLPDLRERNAQIIGIIEKKKTLFMPPWRQNRRKHERTEVF